MPRTHPPYPEEFRKQMVELVRAGRPAPIYLTGIFLVPVNCASLTLNTRAD